jgi:hypothetical protein
MFIYIWTTPRVPICVKEDCQIQEYRYRLVVGHKLSARLRINFALSGSPQRSPRFYAFNIGGI